MSYYDIYQKRLNRFGTDYQSRMQGMREREFSEMCAQSVYKISFTYNSNSYTGVFEKYKQDETQTLHYLLTQRDLNMPAGTILQLPNKDNTSEPWMIYYLEQIKASGYNKYIMLKMTHTLSWTDKSSTARTSPAYMISPNSIGDLTSILGTQGAVRYDEDNNLYTFILPTNQYINVDDYFILGTAPIQDSYRVVSYNRQCIAGVEFVVVNPVYEYDLTPAPTKGSGDTDEEFYWLTGGETT